MINPYLYSKKDAPDYLFGNTLNITFCCLVILHVLTLRMLIKKRDDKESK